MAPAVYLDLFSSRMKSTFSNMLNHLYCSPLCSRPPLWLHSSPPCLLSLSSSSLRPLPLKGNYQAGGLACPAEPNSTACRLRGMYSSAALPLLPSLSPFNQLAQSPSTLRLSLTRPSSPFPPLIIPHGSDAVDLSTAGFYSWVTEWWITLRRPFCIVNVTG